MIPRDNELLGCSYLRTVSASEQPYREGVTVFEQLRLKAYRAGGNAFQVQFVEGNPSQAKSIGSAMTAKVYRCSWSGDHADL